MARAFFPKYLLAAIVFISAFGGYVATFKGQVSTAGRLSGRVSSGEDGTALAAEIGLTVRDKNGITLRHIRASEHGLFDVENLPAGELHLVTKLEGYAAEHRSVSLTEGGSQYVEFLLKKVRRVQGTVLGPTHRPVAGAQVRIIYAADENQAASIQTTYEWETAEVKSDERGNFIISVHPDKEFIIEASHRKYVGTVSAPARIRLAENEIAMTIALSKGVSFSGAVKDEGGNPIECAQVRLLDAEQRHERREFHSTEALKQRAMYTGSGAAGAFEFEQVKPARKILIVQHPEYELFKQMIDLSKGQKQLPTGVTLLKKH